MEKPTFKSQSEHRRSYGATDGVDREADPADGALLPHHDYTARDIDDLTWAINSTPRKSLGFKTPAEAFLENLRCCT